MRNSELKFFLSLLFVSTYCIAGSPCTDGQTRIYRKLDGNGQLEEKCEIVPSKNLAKSGFILVCVGQGFRKCTSQTQENIESEMKAWKPKIDDITPVTRGPGQCEIGPGLQMIDHSMVTLVGLPSAVIRAIQEHVWIIGGVTLMTFAFVTYAVIEAERVSKIRAKRLKEMK